MKREILGFITKSPLKTENKPQANINNTANNTFLMYTCLKLGHILYVLSDFGG
jgi:hypothetical protein